MARLPDLTAQELNDLHQALTLYARFKTLRLSWRGVVRGKSELLPGGLSPEDVAADAMVRVIDERRECNASTYAEWLGHLKGVVDSILSHAVNSLANRSERQVALRSVDGVGPPSRESVSKTANAREVVEQQEARAKLRKDIMAKVEADPLAAGIFQCLEAEITSPSEMAIMLDKSIQDIQNAQKRLRTAVSAILRQQQEVTHGRPKSVR